MVCDCEYSNVYSLEGDGECISNDGCKKLPDSLTFSVPFFNHSVCLLATLFRKLYTDCNEILWRVRSGKRNK